MRRTAAMLAALAVTLVTGCTSWHRSASPAEGVTRAKSGEIRVHRVDGSMIPLVGASIVGDSLIGVSPVTGARVAIPMSAVVSTETKQISAGRSAAFGGGVLLAGVAVVGIIATALLIGALGSY